MDKSKRTKEVAVISPFELREKSRKEGVRYLITCIRYPTEVLLLLEKLGIRDIRVITYWGIKTALRIHAKYIYKNDFIKTQLLKIEECLWANGTMEMKFGYAKIASQKQYYLAYKQFRREVRLPYKYVKHYSTTMWETVLYA